MLKLIRPKKGDLVLDVGCGTGRFSLLLKRRGCKFVGFDFSEGMLKFSKERGLTNVVRGDALHLPFAQNTFRIVISMFVLEFLKDPEQA
ncbi:MAG: class I SAM-dependent methyltransferase, partial [Asgard group archaeon]